MNYYNMYMPQPNLDRINRQIEDLNQLKQQIQSQPQVAPINNYINTNTPKIEMEAKMLTKGQTVEDVIVQNKTVFIDEDNSKVYIKDIDGTINKEYEIVVPKTPEQLRIEELEKELSEMKRRISDDRLSTPNSNGETTFKSKQSTKSNGTNDDTTTKKSS